MCPSLWKRSGVGSDVMQPIVGGMITSTIYVLINNIPVIFHIMKVRALWKDRLKASGTTL